MSPGQKNGKGHFVKPNIRSMQPTVQINEVNYSKATRHLNTLDHSYYGQPCQVQFSNNFRDTNRQPRGLLKKGQRQQHYRHHPRKLVCYFHEGEHMVKDCIKLTKEKSRDRQRDADMTKSCKNKV